MFKKWDGKADLQLSKAKCVATWTCRTLRAIKPLNKGCFKQVGISKTQSLRQAASTSIGTRSRVEYDWIKM